MPTRPITFQWDGEAMWPLNKFRSLCDKQFVVGVQYVLSAEEERTIASHNQFFAEVTEVWKNLPERLAAKFASPEHLRKYALISTGYADSRSIVCESDDEALRVAAFIEPFDPFLIVSVTANVVTVYTAQSQAKIAMKKGLFQQSKRDVLEFLSLLIGTKPSEVSKAAREAGSDDRTRNPVGVAS